MIISQITGGGRYIKNAADSGKQKAGNSRAAQAQEGAATQGREDVFIQDKTREATGVADYRALKKLSGGQIKALKDQRAKRMQRLVTELLGGQAAKAGTAQYTESEKLLGAGGREDWVSPFSGPQNTPETAAQAISKDGDWGVDAVSTRLLDMAVSLSGGDISKIAELRSAVEAGFQAAGDVIGGALPGVCQETYAETMRRFDYWEAHSSMDGYVMQA